ncbi:hypothetical protein Tco_0894254 [Tanacetum coccineum]|uniref:Uncharacterized protein n=1 Tax=Tanacetum coccineum TaxID=301880 RepID=A0ABQ5CE13_9ASTR
MSMSGGGYVSAVGRLADNDIQVSIGLSSRIDSVKRPRVSGFQIFNNRLLAALVAHMESEAIGRCCVVYSVSERERETRYKAVLCSYQRTRSWRDCRLGRCAVGCTHGERRVVLESAEVKSSECIFGWNGDVIVRMDEVQLDDKLYMIEENPLEIDD